MTRHPFDDAFRHDTWATLRLIDVCAALSPEQLATEVPGTYGSILRTLNHVLDSDGWYLSFFRDDGVQINDGRQLALPDLRTATETNGALWLEVLADGPDADRLIEDVDGDVRYLAPVGVRLAQVVQHGTDHRSQICTALTLIGVEPPDISVWRYGDETGRAYEEKVGATPGGSGA